MKLNKTNILLLLVVLLFLGSLIVVTIGSKDSEENQLKRRLYAFVDSLPEDIKNDFLNKNYDAAKEKLQKKIDEYNMYADKLPDNKRVLFIKAEYDKFSNEELKDVPVDLLGFYKKYYAVLDYECIQGFSVSEVVDFFREFFVERLEEINKK